MCVMLFDMPYDYIEYLFGEEQSNKYEKKRKKKTKTNKQTKTKQKALLVGAFLCSRVPKCSVKMTKGLLLNFYSMCRQSSIIFWIKSARENPVWEEEINSKWRDTEMPREDIEWGNTRRPIVPARSIRGDLNWTWWTRGKAIYRGRGRDREHRSNISWKWVSTTTIYSGHVCRCSIFKIRGLMFAALAFSKDSSIRACSHWHTLAHIFSEWECKISGFDPTSAMWAWPWIETTSCRSLNLGTWYQIA